MSKGRGTTVKCSLNVPVVETNDLIAVHKLYC